ncbi:efflux RND transporter periplasmic adaptor subunit [Neptunomonas sp.]|uniref:efflux RND transporter periplasmic adaptor subunit n=2 Tax=Neptunomonas sp. TaxID=1971898 RepID=UPI003562B41B
MKIHAFLMVSLLVSMPVAAEQNVEAEKLLTASLLTENSSDNTFSGKDQALLSAAESYNDRLAVPSLGCLLTPSLDILIASPIAGVIESVLVKKGGLVKEGEVLVKLRSEVEQATLKLNRAQAAYGQRTIKRNTELYQKNLISEQEKDEIIINNRLFGYEAEQTRALLKQKTIRSPLAGVVVETFLDPGEYVGEDPILNVVQLDPLYVEVVVPAKYYGEIAKGGIANVVLDKPWNSTHQATVDIVDQVLDAASGTFGVRLNLANPDYQLPAGLKCDITFAQKE